MPERTTGVIGLGIIGSAVSGSLLKAGFDVIGYDAPSGALQGRLKVKTRLVGSRRRSRR